MAKSCAVFGHSKINWTKELEKNMYKTLENLVIKGCELFYLGGLGEFDELCHKVISELKKTYPSIKRIFVYITLVS